MTTSSVLGNTLRAYALGWFDIERVDRAVTDTVDLIFGEPPAAVDT